ncbi:MAG: aromatic-ring-hydroxylating dioxygenase subunit beta [Candidatus Dormiibacterota bacterium]
MARPRATETTPVPLPIADLQASALDFVQHEARLLDDRRFDEWETLWAADGMYWIPGERDDLDAFAMVQDNRNRITTRVRQMLNADRHSQRPPSRTARTLSGSEATVADGEVTVRSSFVLLESRLGKLTSWGGVYEHRLRVTEGGVQLMVLKKVLLVNRDQALPTMAFLL